MQEKYYEILSFNNGFLAIDKMGAKIPDNHYFLADGCIRFNDAQMVIFKPERCALIVAATPALAAFSFRETAKIPLLPEINVVKPQDTIYVLFRETNTEVPEHFGVAVRTLPEAIKYLDEPDKNVHFYQQIRIFDTTKQALEYDDKTFDELITTEHEKEPVGVWLEIESEAQLLPFVNDENVQVVKWVY